AEQSDVGVHARGPIHAEPASITGNSPFSRRRSVIHSRQDTLLTGGRRVGARRSVVAVVVVLGLLSAACGDDDGVSSTASETTTPSTTEPAATTTTAGEVAEVDELDEIALSEPDDVLAAAVSCPAERAHPDSPGVLLVPGTG